VLQKKNRAELLRHSLARLSPKHGEVINLVYFHGKSVTEVAEIVGIAEATVKTRMFLRAQEVGRSSLPRPRRLPLRRGAGLPDSRVVPNNSGRPSSPECGVSRRILHTGCWWNPNRPATAGTAAALDGPTAPGGTDFFLVLLSGPPVVSFFDQSAVALF